MARSQEAPRIPAPGLTAGDRLQDAGSSREGSAPRIHADHASTGWRLAEAADAEFVLFAGAEASPEFHGVRDGDVLPLGT